jgi:hypothetical protein
LHHAEVISITGRSYRLRHQAAEGSKPANAPTGLAAEPANAPKNSKAEGEVSDGKSANSRRDRKKDSTEPAQT